MSSRPADAISSSRRVRCARAVSFACSAARRRRIPARRARRAPAAVRARLRRPRWRGPRQPGPRVLRTAEQHGRGGGRLPRWRWRRPARRRVARRRAALRAPSFLRLWLLAAAALVAVYTGQELLEGVLTTGHPEGLRGAFGDGGLWALPAAAGVGLLLAAALRGGRRVVAAVAAARIRVAAPQARPAWAPAVLAAPALPLRARIPDGTGARPRTAGAAARCLIRPRWIGTRSCPQAAPSPVDSPPVRAGARRACSRTACRPTGRGRLSLAAAHQSSHRGPTSCTRSHRTPALRLSGLCALALAITLAGCGDSSSPPPPASTPRCPA